LAFGRRSTVVGVWSCELQFNERAVVVPWISSIHVGEAFAETFVTHPPPPPFQKGDLVIVQGSEFAAEPFLKFLWH
jgi:hypothetical protein